MARASVRIQTKKVLELLRKREGELLTLKKQTGKLEADHKKQVEAWESKAAKVAKTAKPAEVSATEVRWGDDAGKVKVVISYILPANKVGERPESPDTFGYLQRNLLEEIQQTIKLLELTDDESVSATAYKNLAQLL